MLGVRGVAKVTAKNTSAQGGTEMLSFYGPSITGTWSPPTHPILSRRRASKHKVGCPTSVLVPNQLLCIRFIPILVGLLILSSLYHVGSSS